MLGLPVRMAWDDSEGSGTILEAGRATLEPLSRDQADLIDRIEVGRRIAGPVRLRSRSKIPPGRRSSSPQAAPSSSPLRPRLVGRPERTRTGRPTACSSRSSQCSATSRSRAGGARHGRWGTGAGEGPSPSPHARGRALLDGAAAAEVEPGQAGNLPAHRDEAEVRQEVRWEDRSVDEHSLVARLPSG